MLNWYRALFRQDLPVPAPGSLAAPVLLLWGLDDPYGVPRLADESAELCAWSRVRRLAGAGHWIHYDAADLVRDELTQFLTGESSALSSRS